MIAASRRATTPWGTLSNVPENEHVGNVLHEDRATRGASLLSRADVATLLRPLTVLFHE